MSDETVYEMVCRVQEPHHHKCDCDECVEAAETAQDDYEQARMHDDD